jgi:hypothetical protein
MRALRVYQPLENGGYSKDGGATAGSEPHVLGLVPSSNARVPPPETASHGIHGLAHAAPFTASVWT